MTHRLVKTHVADVTASLRIRVFCELAAFGLYEGNLLGAFAQNALLKIRAGQIIVCTGRPSSGRSFSPTTICRASSPWRGVLRLARLYGVRAGRRAVVLTDNDDGALAAGSLAALGIDGRCGRSIADPPSVCGERSIGQLRRCQDRSRGDP